MKVGNEADFCSSCKVKLQKCCKKYPEHYCRWGIKVLFALYDVLCGHIAETITFCLFINPFKYLALMCVPDEVKFRKTLLMQEIYKEWFSFFPCMITHTEWMKLDAEYMYQWDSNQTT